MSNASLLIKVIFSLIIFYDVKRRGYSPFLGIGMGIITFMFPILLLPFYLILAASGRVKIHRFGQSAPKSRLETPQICSKCGHENSPQQTRCSACHNQLRLDG